MPTPAESANLILKLFELRREPVLREAHDIRQRALPATSPLIALTATELGTCLTALERYPEAEGYLLEGHRILGEQGGEQRGVEADALRRSRDQLIALYDTWGRPQKADEYRAPPQ